MRRRRILLLAVAALAAASLIAAVAAGLYGLGLRGPAPTAARPSHAPASPADATSPADRLALGVADALFRWDTMHHAGPQQIVQRVIDQARPPDDERAGLEADLAGYVPTGDAWDQLREFHTRQELQVQRVLTPATWAGVDKTGLPSGVDARTVEGVRLRDGYAFGADVRSEHPVSFTIFMACPPEGGPCVALRVSRLNDPLP
jgi:hypothetical protein